MENIDYQELYNTLRQKQKNANRKFYTKNKEIICKKNVCEICGGKYTDVHKIQHEKTKKHCKALFYKKLN